MGKWANHLISAIRYSTDHKYITELVQHEDDDDPFNRGRIKRHYGRIFGRKPTCSHGCKAVINRIKPTHASPPKQNDLNNG